MRALFQSMQSALSRGENLVLCSVINTFGSTPRGKGAKMAVFSDGTTAGTIGGGTVEYRAITMAADILRSGVGCTRSFHLNHNDVADLGMICGGDMTVLFQFLSGASSETCSMVTEICQLFSRRENAWLITTIDGNIASSMGFYCEGSGLHYLKDVKESSITPIAKRCSILQEGPSKLYVEPLHRAEMVYVFGGGHISAELIPLLTHVGFSVTIFEERADFCTPQRFPTAEACVLGSYQEVGRYLTIGPADYVVILTRGHQGDFEVLLHALQTPATYVGVIGSRRKIASTNQRLINCGIDAKQLERIHTPIGLAIGAETPAEIAISIASELIAHRAAEKEATF